LLAFFFLVNVLLIKAKTVTFIVKKHTLAESLHATGRAGIPVADALGRHEATFQII
jgi:hypothetical protein